MRPKSRVRPVVYIIAATVLLTLTALARSSFADDERGHGEGHGRGHHRATPTSVVVLPTDTATTAATDTATSMATSTPTTVASATQMAVPSATATAAITATPVLPPVTATLPAATATMAPMQTATAPAATITAVPSKTATSVVPIFTATATQVPATATVGATATGPATTPIAGSGVVLTIVLENHNWSQIRGSSSAPYINNTLLPQASYTTQYYNPPGTHPSLPNYIFLTSGQTFGIADDAPPSSHPLNTSAHLAALLDAAGVSWKGYMEGISGNGCPTSDNYPYAVKHDPFPYYTSIGGNTAYCQAHVRPYGELDTDLQQGTVPRYSFIVPGLCSDGHDSCAPLNDPVAQIDTWLKNNVPPILASSAYKNGGTLFITFDEGASGSDGPIALIALSPKAKGGGYNNAIHYTHASLLRTEEELLGVMPLLGAAANATDLRDLFQSFP